MALSWRRHELPAVIVRNGVLIAACGLETLDTDSESVISLVGQPVCFPYSFP